MRLIGGVCLFCSYLFGSYGHFFFFSDFFVVDLVEGVFLVVAVSCFLSIWCGEVLCLWSSSGW